MTDTSKTEFYENYPLLMEKVSVEILDSDHIWKWLVILHDLFEVGLMNIARKEHPNWSFKEIRRCARYSMLQCISEPTHGFSDRDMFLSVMREWLFGDMDIAEQLGMEFFKRWLIAGANKTAIYELARFAKPGERFLDSKGHERKKENFEQRNAMIRKEYANLKAKLESPMPKKAAIYRLSAKHALSFRQIERILRH